MGKSSINKMLNKIDNHLFLSHSNSKRCFVFLLETMKILSTKHKDRVSVPYTYHLQVADTPYFQLLLRFLKVLLYDIQAQRQEFPYGGSSTTIASRASRLAGCYITAGGLGSTQGPKKPLGIWCKILQSSNFHALHSNFRRVLFSKTDC